MKVFKNIKALVGVNWGNELIKGERMGDIPMLENAYLVTEGEKIKTFGTMDTFNGRNYANSETIDSSDQFVLPAWSDAHTHIVFAGSREHEYVDKIKGLTYSEIAAKGGGILNSARLLNGTSEQELYDSAYQRIMDCAQNGTASFEIKSGYSMTLDGEMKMLRVIRRLKDTTPFTIKATYLAHTFPMEYKDKKDAYVNEVIKTYIPKIAEEGLADFIDVFCDEGFYTEKQTDQILETGVKYGLKPKVHANQLSNSGGVQSAVRYNALSADHLEQIEEDEISLLKKSATIPVLLPTAAFFLRLPYPPARKMIDEGLGFALATDYNPGSSPSGNMPLLLSLASIQMKITPHEAISAATINGAAAMEVADITGSIDKGKLANLIFTKKIPSLSYLTYSFGTSHIGRVMVKGKFQ